MITLNSVFDKIYCINLDRRPDRWKECEREFERINLEVERFSACDGNALEWDTSLLQDNPLLPGELGIIQSHLKIAEDALKKGYENILILEDDVEFSENFVEDFNFQYKFVPEDWDMLYLGGNLVGWNPNRGIVNEYVGNGYHIFAAHALGMNRDVICDMYMNHYTNKPIDVWYCDNSVYYNSYMFIPRMAWQRASYSDIQNTEVNYGFLKTGQWGMNS